MAVFNNKISTNVVAANLDEYTSKEVERIYWKDGTVSSNCKTHIREALIFGQSHIILEEGLWKEYLDSALYVVFKEAI